MRRGPVPALTHVVVAAILIAGLFACRSSSPAPLARRSPTPPIAVSPSPIVTENEKEGAPNWIRPTDETAIAGYADATSVNVGETLNFAVSTRSSSYFMDIYRIGWYGGRRGRLVMSVTGLTGMNQGYWTPGHYGVANCPTCTTDPATWMLDANWRTTYSLKVPRDWVSGNYVAQVTTNDDAHGLIYFVVRNDTRPSRLLVVMPVNSYQAYNGWGGKSLYDSEGTSYGSHGPRLPGVASPRALKVTFNRPYFSDIIGFDWRDHDFDMVAFMERLGYDVSYATSVDLDRDPRLLLDHRAFVSIGHDEYWSRGMRTNAGAALAAGVNLAFMGGNDVFWQVRYEPDAHGGDRRVLVCYKDHALDPLATGPSATLQFQMIGQPQNSLTGTIFDYGSPIKQPWVVTDDAPTWLLAETGLTHGQSVPNLSWFECDKVADNGSQPPTLKVVGRATFQASNGRGECDSIWFVAPSRGEVFNVADEGWTYGLDNPAVAQMTVNLFNRFERDRSPHAPALGS